MPYMTGLFISPDHLSIQGYRADINESSLSDTRDDAWRAGLTLAHWEKQKVERGPQNIDEYWHPILQQNENSPVRANQEAEQLLGAECGSNDESDDEAALSNGSHTQQI